MQTKQLHKNESQPTKVQHATRPWRLDKALVSHLPLVVLLCSTCWLLTGCDLQTSRTSGPLLQSEPPQQDSQISCQSLTVKSDQETFQQFFIERKTTAIWEKLLFRLQNPQTFGDPYAIILKDCQISGMLSQHPKPIQEQLQAAIKLYIESQNQLGLLSIQDFSEEAFQNFLVTNELQSVWQSLDQQRGGYYIKVTGMLQACTPPVRTRVVKGLVQFIRTYSPDLDTLDLSDNRLTELPDIFENFGKLKLVNLRNNPLIDFPVSLQKLGVVVIGPSLTQEEEAFSKFLDANKLYAIWPRLSQKRWKSTLDLSEMLQDLPQTVQTRVLERVVQYICNHYPDLIALDLSDNGLKALPDIFKKLDKLQRLDLSYNKLQALPDTFVNLKSLKILNLHNNQLTQLPNSFGDLAQLQILNLHHNYLIKLPQSFAKLTQLQRLDLYHNNLTALPDIFAKLNNLQILDLYNNKLTTLPLSCRKFINLPECSLDNNLLQRLKEDIAFRNLLVANRLDSVWKKLDQARGKDRLDLSGMLRCNPAQQPHVLDGLVQFMGRYFPDLRVLDLSSNGLQALPDSFVNLKNLEILNLSDNKLTALPKFFGNLTQLKKLHLDHNPLTQLPESFQNLTK